MLGPTYLSVIAEEKKRRAAKIAAKGEAKGEANDAALWASEKLQAASGPAASGPGVVFKARKRLEDEIDKERLKDDVDTLKTLLQM